MGSICPCLRRKKTIERSSPYDVHETFEIQEHIGSEQSGTKQNFQVLAQERHETMHTVLKQSQAQISKVSNNKSTEQKDDQDNLVQDLAFQQKGSTKSLIRKRLHESIENQNNIDESLENLERTKKIVTAIYNLEKQVTIRSCKKSSIFIFDTTSSISIEKCSECVIYCAPCSGKVSISNCKDMKLLLICAKLEIRRSKECDISLFSSSPPQISNSSELCFSNFMRVGYCDLAEQFADTNLEVWNNRFLDVEDLDQDPDEQHYSQKKLNLLDIEWAKVLSEARVEEADPVVPLFWGDSAISKRKEIYVMNEPIREIESKLLKYIISNNITIHKAFKGILPTKAFQKMKDLFPDHQQNKYLCLIMGKELEASGFQAYFERISGKDVDAIQSEIFPSVERPE